ncbi:MULTISPECIES: sulfite exporter TauE/SafE family protein [Oleiagrimonas]|uniref:Sulfite exporter TauE/SafE family protein n=1 Tax=Oleiagrimonas citrea TaxID=1665687 RepID=A0A846ZKD6_9GAMM|nr:MULTISPECIES: sulfite exporter TauE/SafE family protein [Oleiagrimonas]NKZ37861.1 sulfite exporter TauE/SafE family protein [Oleiagrimonas citrea]RAP57365.1 hypothetical protein BTJ49_09805 [Oleiagrimonas sp. MCCC 1A03011]
MTGALTIAAAALLGLAGSGHCALMCGGISHALGLATQRRPDGRPRRALLLTYQFGRISGYALAGLLLGSVGAALYGWLDDATLRLGLRVLMATAFVVIGVGLWTGRGVLDRIAGTRVWAWLSPRMRRLLPVDSLPKAWMLGLAWGWMPCGFVYTVLLLAWTSLDPWSSAATMAAFGLGTLPAVLGVSLGADFLSRTAGAHLRRGTAVVMLGMAALTLAGPWLAPLGMPDALLPFDCVARG